MPTWVTTTQKVDKDQAIHFWRGEKRIHVISCRTLDIFCFKKGRHFLWIVILNNRPACTMIFMLPDFLYWKIYVWTITFKALNWTSVREQNWYSLGHSSFCTPVIVEGKKQSFSNNIQIHIVGCHVRWWTFGLVQSDRTLGIILERNSEFDVSARPAVIS